MTAIHSVVPGRGLETAAPACTTWTIRSDDIHRPLAAVRRSAQFWSVDAPDERSLAGVPPLPVDDDSSSSGAWLMRRPARRSAVALISAGRPAEFIELRGPDELAAASRVLAEAFGMDEGQIAPRRISLPPEPLHLRTWALFSEARVLSCALSVVVEEVVVLCAVATRPALQGLGLGSQLVRELHRLHDQTGVVREFVACAPLAGVSCFERLGYDAVMEWPTGTAIRGRTVLRQVPAGS